ncbi:MAG TPA: CDP-alcohol phosphatidyltransferase family protein [Bacillota bacterium]|nr:CDP-alcohol phosphatidyltransferase family protein [Bacillota bacterium]
MTLASWITSSRFIFAPLIYWQLASGTQQGLVWAVVFLLLAGVSDLLDGWAARSRNEVTELGKLLDPLTDKLTILAMLTGAAWSWNFPWWLVFGYAGKELLQVLAGAFLIKQFNELIPANRWGKNATFGFFCGFALYLWQPLLGVVVITLALGLSVYALHTYYLAYLELKRQKTE